jgi:predicted PurR-regulated permease PerM
VTSDHATHPRTEGPPEPPEPADRWDPEGPPLPDEPEDEVALDEAANQIVLPPPPADEPVTPRTVFRYAVAAALGVVLVGLALLLAYNMRAVLVQIVIAAFIAMSLDPAVRWLNRHRVPRGYAVALIFVLFLAVLVVLSWLAVPPLLKQAGSLTSDFPGYLDSLRNRSDALRDFEDRFNLRPRTDQFASTFLTRIQSDALEFGQRFLGALLSALLVLVLTIYFMADLPRLRRGLVRLFPPRARPNVSLVTNVLIDKVGAYMIGNLVISVIAGVTTFVALSLLKVPFALPLAFFVALTDLIPMIGATLGAVVCTIVALATTPFWPNVVVVALFFVVYQQLENYLIAPRVLRNTVDIPAIAVLLAALLGASVLGLVGALMAIPVAAAIKVLATPVLRARDANHTAAREEAPAQEAPS